VSEERESLADQAAAWVPPWDRDRQTEPADATDANDSAAVATPPASPEPGEPADASPPADTPVPGPDDPLDGPDLPAPLAGALDDGSVVPVATPDLAGATAMSDISSTEFPDASGPVDGEIEDAPSRAGTADGKPANMPVPSDLDRAAGRAAPDCRDLAAVGAPSDAPDPEADGPAADGRDAGPTALALVHEDELRGALEAILLVVDEPVPEIVLAQIVEQPTERVVAALEAVAAGYTEAGHGFELRRAAGGWRLYTRPRYATYVERFVLDGQRVRLTQAALETLAVVAYRQPVTRSRISAIRGVNCDGVIRTLTSRGLVEECGTEPESGAYLYRTTTLFLEKLGLDSVAELPPLAPFLPDELDEIADAQR
jgi:segregation and condensation protein B